MLLPSGNNPFKCHEEVLYFFLQPVIRPKRFDIFPLTGGCSEGLDAFRFFLLNNSIDHVLMIHILCGSYNKYGLPSREYCV